MTSPLWRVIDSNPTARCHMNLTLTKISLALETNRFAALAA